MSIVCESKARLDDLVATINAKTERADTDLTAAISALMQKADFILNETITIASTVHTTATEIFASDKLAGGWTMAFIYKKSIDDNDRQVCWAVRVAYIQEDAIVKNVYNKTDNGGSAGSFSISSSGVITVNGYSGTDPYGVAYNVYWKSGDYRLIVI